MPSLAACRATSEGATAGSSPPIVLVTIDTLRADHLPAYGYGNGATPAIDRLRADAVLFRQAFAQVPLTLPSHVSLLSGRLPPVHGVRDNLGFDVAPDLEPWLPALLRGRGYATGGFVSAYVLRRETGIARGFDRFDDRVDFAPGDLLAARSRSGEESARQALAWVDSVRSRPWFVWLHLYEPHAPYHPPPPFAEAFPGRAYDGEIAAADRYAGEFLDGLRSRGVYDGALIVLASDHGEGLGNHGEAEHGFFVYQEDLWVPLLVKLPHGERRGEVVERPVQLVDVVPTIAARLGMEGRGSASGCSLLAPASGSPLVYAESYYGRLHFGWSELVTAFDGRYRYIRAPRPELYDLRRDPDERRNLVDAERPAAARLAAELAPLVGGGVRARSSDTESSLGVAALGYLAGRAGLVEGPLPDPKDGLGTIADLHRALAEFQQRNYAAAVPLFERVVASSPRALDAWDYLGRTRRALGRHREALAAFVAADRAAGGDADYTLAAAWSELDLGRRAAALRRIARGLALPHPDLELARRLAARLCREGALAEGIAVLRTLPLEDPETRAALAMALAEAGQAEEALRVLGDPAGEPPHAAMEEARSVALLRLGRWADAERCARAALAVDTGRAPLWNDLGVALAGQGKTAAAADAWRRALALDPRLADARRNLETIDEGRS